MSEGSQLRVRLSSSYGNFLTKPLYQALIMDLLPYQQTVGAFQRLIFQKCLPNHLSLDGHNSEGGDLSWATPASLWDWGYRALHGSVVAGRVLIEHYYGKPILRSYYAGCSTGGRQVSPSFYRWTV